jgi:hypothetical protein
MALRLHIHFKLDSQTGVYGESTIVNAEIDLPEVITGKLTDQTPTQISKLSGQRVSVRIDENDVGYRFSKLDPDGTFEVTPPS